MLIMEKQEKKTPTVEQVMEYRTWFDNLTDEAMAKISAFEREYNLFTHVYEEKGIRRIRISDLVERFTTENE